MPRIAVLRLGRLGDLVMTEPALRWLADTPGVEVDLVTDAAYVGVFSQLLDGVRVLPSSGPVEADFVLDLHGVARSRRLRAGHRGLSVSKEGFRRRLSVLAPGLGLQARLTWPERHLLAVERALGQLGVRPGRRPEPTPRFAPWGSREPDLLGVSPGAGWNTKRWPVEHFRELLRLWPGRSVVFGAAQEQELVASVGGEAWADSSLEGLVAGLSRCGVLVAGDTGPLHLAAALGARVVGLFGSTPVNTGFWTWEEQGTLLRAEGLACSPCSMHGRRRCPRGHHRCMEDLSPQRVVEAARCA